MSKSREITSAVIQLNVELRDLGVFGPGSSYAQAKQAAAKRINELLNSSGFSDRLIGDVLIKSIHVNTVQD